MPALTKSRLGSPRGRTGEDGTNRWPCLTRKKSRNALRIRAAGSSGGGQPPSDRAERTQRWLGRPLTGQSFRWTSRNMRTTEPAQTQTELGRDRVTAALTAIRLVVTRLRTENLLLSLQKCPAVGPSPPSAVQTAHCTRSEDTRCHSAACRRNVHCTEPKEGSSVYMTVRLMTFHSRFLL